MAKNKKYESENDMRQRLMGVAKSISSPSSESPAEISARRGNKDINFAGAEVFGERAKIRKISNRIILDSGTNIERALKLMSGLIACPNGGTETVLNYAIGDGDDAYSDNEAAKVLPVLVNYLRDEVKYHNQVFNIVYRCLATDGSDTEIYLPNTAVSNLINTHGLLENEQFKSDIEWVDLENNATEIAGVSITNNPNVLFRGLAIEQRTLKGALESDKKSAGSKKLDLEVKNILNMRRRFKSLNTLKLNSGIKEDATGMRVKQLPSESVAPLHLNGPDEEPIYYITILDPTTGMPIQIEDDINFNRDLAAKSNDKNAERFRVLGNSVGVQDFKAANSSKGLESLYDSFKSQIIDNVTKSLLDGNYADVFTVEQDSQIIDIMFHRFLRDQKVQLLILDPDMVSYIAADKNRFGIGESLVTKTESLALMYVTLFYATFLANLESAIPRKKMRATMSEWDTEQEKTVEIIMGEYAKSLKSPMDWNVTGNRSLLDNLARHGLQLEIEGGNPETSDIPQFNIQIEDIKRQIEAADESFLDWLGKLVIQKTNMSAETVDNSYSPEFSSEVARDNDLTARQMSEYVSIFNDCLTDRGIKRVANNPVVMARMLEALGSGENNEVKLAAMLARFTVSLPSPEVSAFERDLEKLQQLSTAIDSVLEDIMPDWVADAMADTDVEELRAQREVVKAALMRDFILRNNAFRGMIESISTGEIDDAIENEFFIAGNISKVIAKNSDKLKKIAAGITKRREKVIEKIESGDLGDEQPTPAPEPERVPEPDDGDVTDPAVEEVDNPDEPTPEQVESPEEDADPNADDNAGGEFNIDDLPQ